MNTAIAQKIAALAEHSARSQGMTVKLKLSANAYTGPSTDRILYQTPENKGIKMSISKSLEDGWMNVFATPESADDARRVIAQLEAA